MHPNAERFYPPVYLAIVTALCAALYDDCRVTHRVTVIKRRRVREVTQP